MSTSRFVLRSFHLLMIMVLFAGCTGQPTPTATPRPSQTPEKTPTLAATLAPSPTPNGAAGLLNQGGDLPPVVISSGGLIASDGVVEVRFSQPMDSASTAATFKLKDADGKPVDGKLEWPSAEKLLFRPQQPLKTGALYRVVVGDGAKSAKGAAMRDSSTLDFQVTGAIGIGQIFPADGTQGVANDSAITVLFNRPIVPLRVAEEQNKLPDPLKIDPPVAGKGEWVNTSVYVFHPAKLFKSSTQYSVTIPAGLTDGTGGGSAPLPEEYRWSFTTMPPAVKDMIALPFGDEQQKVSISTDYAYTAAPLNLNFRLVFVQPMDQAATAAAISLTPVDVNGVRAGQPLHLNFKWNDDNTQVDLGLDGKLGLESAYLLTVSTAAQAADGGSLAKEMRWRIETVLSPKVIGTNPADGARSADPWYFEADFASPMNIKSVSSLLSFNPPLITTEGQDSYYYDPYRFAFTFWGLQASTHYTVKFGAGMEDIYGNAIPGEKTIQFTTGALPPSAWIASPQTPMWRAGTSADFYFQMVNVNQAEARLYRLTLEDVKAFEDPQKGTGMYQFIPNPETLVVKKAFQPDLAKDKNGLAKVTFEPVPTGFYLLGLEVPQIDHRGSTFNDVRMVVVSNGNLTVKVSQLDALLWLTDQTTGKPIPGTHVSLFDSPNFTQLGEGTTDGDGLLKLEIAPSVNPSNYLAIADEPGGETFAYGATYWGSGVWPGEFGIGEAYYATWQPGALYVYTERPIYRPGQTVYFKGILRQDDDLKYSLPDKKTISLKISSFDKEIYRTELPVSDYGTFNGTFPLDSEAALGPYTLTVFNKDQEDQPLGGVTFSVAEYRRPEFQVVVNTAPVNVLSGESFSANIKAEYYSGGGVANATVNWTLRNQPFTFTPPSDFSKYSFDDYDRDIMDASTGSHAPESDSPLAEGSGQTDGQGLLTLTIPANLEKEISQKLVLEVTITDLSGAAVTGRTELVAHRSMVYPGIRFTDYVGQVKTDQTIELAALDWDGKPLAGQKVNVEIVERRWHNVQEQNPSGEVRWTSTVEEIPVTTIKDVIMDSGGKGSITFSPPNGGVFRARVTAVDSKGKTGSASAYIWVAGEEYIPWRQGNDRGFQLIADRDSYQVGDTAQILIASPFQGQNYALVTIERGRIRQQKVLLLENNSTIYPLPITSDLAPNAYISVLVMKGVDENNPFPDFREGMAEIKVSTDKQALKLEVTPDKTQAGPGDEVTYAVRVSDLDGKPVEAEVSLGLSDLATLSLADPNSLPILDSFYNRRSLSVMTGISIVNSLEANNASLEAQVEQQGRGQGSGGGKGSGELGVIEIRQDFPDTAYWKADVRTDESGQASVTVKLPDNLTIWRMDARAVTLDTRVGQTTTDLRSSKPLLVRPQTPRFFVAGDQVTLGTAVHNNSDQNLSVDVTLDSDSASLQSPATQTVKIDAQQQAYVTWKVGIPTDVERVQFTFSAKGGPFQDASRPTIGAAGLEGLPVYRYEAPESVAASGQMTENGARAEAIQLPENWNVTQGQLTVSVAPSLTASLTDGLNYLKNYPYECAEQTISRFLPNVAIARVLKEAGVQDPALEDGLKEQVNFALQHLAKLQNSDGGWGYWTDGPSDDLVTAYAVLGLLEAKEAAYTVPEKMLADAVSYLTNHASGSSLYLDQTALDNRHAFVLYVLTRAGDKPADQANLLFERRVNLQVYARAFLAQALWLMDANDPRLDTLRSDLNNAAVLSASGTHWNEAYADRWNWNSDTRTTAIVLDALDQIDPKSPITANAVRWLMSHRKDGHWEGTQETAWTLLSLGHWMSVSGDLKANYSYAVAFNGSTVGQGDANLKNLQQVWTTQMQVKDLLKDAVNKLVFARTGGDGNLYYTANLKVWLPVNEVQALNRGVIVSRSYTRADGTDTPVTSAEQGELIRVRLTITSPAGLHYLLVEDPFPAGLEAVDTNLLTSPQGEQPQEYASNDWEKMGWGWWYFNHAELRDEKLVLSSTYLPAGTYVYTYLVRASTKGVFNVIPPTAQEFYFPEVYGRGDGMSFEVK